MRLDGLISHTAALSRAAAREKIQKGRVTVDGVTLRDPAAHVLDTQAVTLDGKALNASLARTLMLFKPEGVLTAAEDSRQKTVMDILPPVYRALGCMPVGRLDKDTTGLLLLTTDGVLAHRLISPRREIDKVYIARVDGTLSEKDAALFQAGIPLKDFTALPATLEILAPDTAKITVHEGKFHQVKRMLHAAGHETLALHRASFGPLSLDKALAPGDMRELTKEETAALYEAAGMTEH